MRAANRIWEVATGFQFGHEVGFTPQLAREILREVPEGPGVFGLFGANTGDQPYLTRGANLRRRMARLLSPPEVLGPDGTPVLSKRLNLRERVVRIGWTRTGSEFESLLVLYRATAALFGVTEARRRLKLGTPFFLRLTTEHAHPRVYSTNRLSRTGLGQMYGPFASRGAAERYADAVLDLFRLRRCYEDLQVHPEHPGCAYGEMRKCMAPCNASCTAEEYGAEARAVKTFFETRGESLLAGIVAERELASEEMDFERAAGLHRQWEKVKAAAALADELVRPVMEVRAVVVQAAAPSVGDPEEEAGAAEVAAVFLLEGGCMAGPQPLSTLGVRAVKEQTSVGSSLFAQPLMLQAVPLGPGAGVGEAGRSAPLRDDKGAVSGSGGEGTEGQASGRWVAAGFTESPEERAARVLAELAASNRGEADLAMLSDQMSLFRRWYYRPEKQRTGEVFLPNADGSWPLRRILRGAARTVIGEPRAMAETDRAGAKGMKTKVLHEGRPDVERVVPVIGRATGSNPAEGGMEPEKPEAFRSRRVKKLAGVRTGSREQAAGEG